MAASIADGPVCLVQGADCLPCRKTCAPPNRGSAARIDAETIAGRVAAWTEAEEPASESSDKGHRKCRCLAGIFSPSWKKLST